MNRVILVLWSATALALAACNSSPPAQQAGSKPAGSAQAAQAYVCSMHPEVRDTKESNCPKCGMKLVPADAVQGGHAH